MVGLETMYAILRQKNLSSFHLLSEIQQKMLKDGELINVAVHILRHCSNEAGAWVLLATCN